MIGGNIDLILQTKTTTVDEIGARQPKWGSVQTLHGWLDYLSGEAGRTNYDAKIQESTHFFICDYVALKKEVDEAEECRAIANGKVYEVVLIDDPMEMHRQLEIYLKYTGAQHGED